MIKGSRFAISIVFALGCIFTQSEKLLKAQDTPDDKHHSPRATVRTLLTAITVARGSPQLIQNAATCLDLGGLPADQRKAGGLLATQLEAVLRTDDVDTNLIPDDIKETIYVLPNPRGQRIALRRMENGQWLFDRETVSQIPKFYAETQKHLQDKNKEAASLNVSPEHASARATFRTLVDAYRRKDYPRMLRSFDLGDIPTVAREEVGTQLGNKLKQVILRHRLPILQEMPDSNFSDPYVFLSQPEGIVELVRLPSGTRKGEWVFSADTVRSIDSLFVAFEDKPYVDELQGIGLTGYLPTWRYEPELWLRAQLPSWLRVSVLTTQHSSVEVYELLGYVLVLALAYGLSRLVIWLLVKFLRRLLIRRQLELSWALIEKRLRPVGRFVGVLFMRQGFLELGPDRVLLVPLLVLLNPLVWVLGMWAIFRGIDLISDIIESRLTLEKRRTEISQMLWPVGSLAVKIGVFVATMFHLMAIFSWDVAAVLTGLGIGGLAFALGAQDTLKNLFGSFTLIADRPFVVGESVKIGNHEVGVVEVVGLRSTRIRTTDDTLLIVPNSNLTTMEITNYGRRRYRRYQTRIAVAYSTSVQQLAAFRDGIDQVIRKQPETRKDHFEVAINDLAAKSIEILVNVYFEVGDRHDELVARDAFILEILGLADALKIERA